MDDGDMKGMDMPDEQNAHSNETSSEGMPSVKYSGDIQEHDQHRAEMKHMPGTHDMPGMGRHGGDPTNEHLNTIRHSGYVGLIPGDQQRSKIPVPNRSNMVLTTMDPAIKRWPSTRRTVWGNRGEDWKGVSGGRCSTLT